MQIKKSSALIRKIFITSRLIILAGHSRGILPAIIVYMLTQSQAQCFLQTPTSHALGAGSNLFGLSDAAHKAWHVGIGGFVTHLFRLWIHICPQIN
jgi:hypothetical protein